MCGDPHEFVGRIPVPMGEVAWRGRRSPPPEFSSVLCDYLTQILYCGHMMSRIMKRLPCTIPFSQQDILCPREARPRLRREIFEFFHVLQLTADSSLYFAVSLETWIVLGFRNFGAPHQATLRCFRPSVHSPSDGRNSGEWLGIVLL